MAHLSLFALEWMLWSRNDLIVECHKIPNSHECQVVHISTGLHAGTVDFQQDLEKLGGCDQAGYLSHFASGKRVAPGGQHKHWVLLDSRNYHKHTHTLPLRPLAIVWVRPAPSDPVILTSVIIISCHY